MNEILIYFSINYLQYHSDLALYKYKSSLLDKLTSSIVTILYYSLLQSYPLFFPYRFSNKDIYNIFYDLVPPNDQNLLVAQYYHPCSNNNGSQFGLHSIDRPFLQQMTLHQTPSTTTVSNLFSPTHNYQCVPHCRSLVMSQIIGPSDLPLSIINCYSSMLSLSTTSEICFNDFSSNHQNSYFDDTFRALRLYSQH